MSPRSQYGRTLLVKGFQKEASAEALTRLRLQSAGSYDEAWLQGLIADHPNLLPIEDIEPALVPAISICKELPVPSGYIDNLLATPAGDLIVVETKLWRNPEARREVVGQIIDYAKDLSGWDYERLSKAISGAQNRETSDPAAPTSLYQLIRSVDPDADEVQFIDAVTRTLKRGRFLLLIVGDGIQENAESIATFLQQHAGLHFTLAFVEMAIFALPDEGGYLVQPRVLARTTNIDRGIVSIHDGRIIVTPPEAPTTAPSAPKRTSISEERFYEELSKSSASAPSRLQAFVERLSALDVSADFGSKSLILRWRPDETRSWNLGAVVTDGKVWTEYLHAQTNFVGLLDLSHAFTERLARIVPGAYVKKTKPLSWHVDKDGTYVLIDDLLDHADEWYAAIAAFTSAVRDALKNE